MSPIAILTSVWLIVIGYGLLYVGYENWSGKKVSFQQAFFGSGGLGGATAPVPSGPGTTSPAASQWQGLAGSGGGANTTGRSSGTQVLA